MITKLLEVSWQNGFLRGVVVVPEVVASRVVFVPGFERNGTTEKIFKEVSDKLAENNIASLRIDLAGCGLSDESFFPATVANQAEQLQLFLKSFNSSQGDLSVVAHSLGACIVAEVVEKQPEIFQKIVLLSPALNQAALLRWWFALSQTDKEINWNNYQQYFEEKDFEEFCHQKKHLTKKNYLSANYYLENKEKDYSPCFADYKERVLHVHGQADDDVPLASLNIDFPHRVLVKNGDHRLQTPPARRQWIGKAVEFLSEE